MKYIQLTIGWTRSTRIAAAFILAVSTILPAFMFTQPAAAFSGGNGSQASPYTIADCDQLLSVQTNIAGNSAAYANKHYALVNDIDMDDCSGEYYHPIGGTTWDDTPFSGVFDGRGHKISNLQQIVDGDSSMNVGLFGYVTGASIHDVHLVNIDYFVVATYANIGGLIGYGEHVTVERVSVTGSIGASYFEGYQNPTIGGMFGAVADIQARDIYADVDVDSTTSSNDTGYSNQLWVGGIAGNISGYNDDESTVTNAYTRGRVSAQGARLQMMGGFVGYLSGSTISNSFAAPTDISSTSSVAGAEYNIGSFAGTIASNGNVTGSSALSVAASLVGQNDPDAEIGTVDDVSPGAAYYKSSTHQPMSLWDFNSVWNRDESGVIEDGFPYLRVPPAVGINNDKNGDGIVDTAQEYVSPVTSSVTGKTVVLEVDDSCSVDEMQMKTESGNIKQDTKYSYPQGLMDFEATCGTSGFTATIKQYYYDVQLDELSLRKYNPITEQYAAISDADLEQQTIYGQSVVVATYQVTDGGALDADGTANGTIVDPAGLASLLTPGIPNTGFSRQGGLVGILMVASLVAAIATALALYAVKYARSKQ